MTFGDWFECIDCWNCAPLTKHGICARCGSNAVLSIVARDLITEKEKAAYCAARMESVLREIERQAGVIYAV